MSSGGPAANWYPDPARREQYRWWDGTRWTDRASSSGKVTVSPLPRDSVRDSGIDVEDRLVRHLNRHVELARRRNAPPLPSLHADASLELLEQPLLVFKNDLRLDLDTDYDIVLATGELAGQVTQRDQTRRQKIGSSLVAGGEQFYTEVFDVTDANGATVLTLTRPRGIRVRFEVTDGSGRRLGEIVDRSSVVSSYLDLALEAGGRMLGQRVSVRTQSLSSAAYIEDAFGNEVGLQTSDMLGSLKETLTGSDSAASFVVQMYTPLPQPFRSLAYASVIAWAVFPETFLR